MSIKNSKQINLIKIWAVWTILLLLTLAIGVLRGISRDSTETPSDKNTSKLLKMNLFKNQSGDTPNPSAKKRDYLKASSWPKGMRLYRDWWKQRDGAVYVAEMDRNAKNIRFGVELANARIIGREKISDMARRRVESDSPILAAVNAGFGIRQDARGRGGMFFNLHIQDWELVVIPPRRNRWGYSPPSAWGETSFGVTTKGEYLMDAVELNGVVRINRKELKVDCINQICDSESPAVIYTARFGEQTLTRGDYELTLKQLKLPLKGKYRSRFVITAINPEGNSPIPKHGIVLALNREFAREWKSQFVEGGKGELRIALSPNKWQKVPYGVGGDVRLLRDGEIEPELIKFHKSGGNYAPKYSNGAAQHPRSAMGFNDDKLFLMTVDGRQAGYSMGMTFYEMAAFFRDLGLKHAINLDGGSSATLWGFGDVINRPSRGDERRVFNVAAITVRTDGKRKK
jgi:hypothetical protein